MKRTLIPDDYDIVEDMMAPPGGRVEVRDHIKISTSERVEVERGGGGVLAVHIVPARGPAVGLSLQSSSAVSGGSNCDLLYRGGEGGSSGGRRAPRHLPQN